MNRSNLYHTKSDRKGACGLIACLRKHDKNIALDVFVQAFNLPEGIILCLRHEIQKYKRLTASRVNGL